MSDIGKPPYLTERLVERGLADEDIRKMLGSNLMCAYREVYGE